MSETMVQIRDPSSTGTNQTASEKSPPPAIFSPRLLLVFVVYHPGRRQKIAQVVSGSQEDPLQVQQADQNTRLGSDIRLPGWLVPRPELEASSDPFPPETGSGAASTYAP